MSNIARTQELKSLQSQRDKIRGELEQAKTEQKDWSKKVNDLIDKLNFLDKKIATFAQKDVVVSEHAYLRYFTRVLGFDLEEIKMKILTPTAETAIREFLSGVFPNGDGVRLKVKDGVVVTILTKDD